VPYNDFLIIQSQKLQESLKKKGQQSLQQVKLDFQNIQSRILCFDMQVEFNFTNDSLMALSKTLSTFPTIKNEKQMPLIKFGSTINNVKLESI